MTVTAQVSKITAKGQTTVPRMVRDLLHVGASDYLVWEQRGDVIIVRPGMIQPRDHFDELAAKTEARFADDKVTEDVVKEAVQWARKKHKSQ